MLVCQLDLLDALPLVFSGWALPRPRRRLPRHERKPLAAFPSLFDQPPPRRRLPVLAPRRSAPVARPVMIVPGANADAIRRELAARYARTPDDAIPGPLQRSARVKAIIREVAAAYGVSVEAIWSDYQRADDVLPRHEIFFRVRHETGLSYPQIAHKCGGPGGGRDMTTVFYAVQRAMPARLAAGWRMRTQPNVAGVGADGALMVEAGR